MFITTANVVEKLPAPLLDSLEVIHFPGYTENEKLNIARNYLIPGQLREHALHQLGLTFSDDGILRIIRDYTREAGLRNLEREITAICRKLARICLADKGKSCALTVDQTNRGGLPGAPEIRPGSGRGGQPGRDGHRAGMDRIGRGAHLRGSLPHERQ